MHRAILPLPILSYPVSAVNSRAYIPEQHTLLHHFIICNWLTLQAPIALRLCLTTDLLLHAYYTAIHEKYKCPTGFFRSRLSAPRLPVHSFSNGHLPVLWFSERYAAGFAAHTLFGLFWMVRRFGLRKKKGQG